MLGFSQVDYITDERPQLEELGVSVEVLFGRLERSVVVWINSTQESTATPGQGLWDKRQLVLSCPFIFHMH